MNPRYGLQIITPPPSGITVVSLDTIKSYLNLDGDNDDDLIADLLCDATAWVESETQQQIFTATKLLTLDRFPSISEYSVGPGFGRVPVTLATAMGLLVSHPEDRVIVLPTPPLQSVASVNYVLNGQTLTLDPSAYVVDAAGKPGRIVLNGNQTWPQTDDVANAVQITFTCGYGATAASVPRLFATAIRWLVSHLYERREVVEEGRFRELPLGLENVLGQLMFREAYCA